MKKSIDIKLVRFYLWLGLGYAALWILSILSTFQGTFLQSVGNNLWRVAYLVVFNFIFFRLHCFFCYTKKEISHLQYSPWYPGSFCLLYVVVLWGVCLEIFRNSVRCLCRVGNIQIA